MAEPGLLEGLGSVASGLFGASAAQKAAEENAKAQRYAAELQAKTAANQLAFGKQQAQAGDLQSLAQQKAYQESLGRGASQMGAGEEALNLLNKTPEELMQMKADIASGNAETLQQGSGQLAANLASQGVRGAQAATQMRRGIGEMATNATRDVNTLIGQDAQNRQAQLMAYQAAKAARGQGANLNAQGTSGYTGFKY